MVSKDTLLIRGLTGEVPVFHPKLVTWNHKLKKTLRLQFNNMLSMLSDLSKIKFFFYCFTQCQSKITLSKKSLGVYRQFKKVYNDVVHSFLCLRFSNPD